MRINNPRQEIDKAFETFISYYPEKLDKKSEYYKELYSTFFTGALMGFQIISRTDCGGTERNEKHVHDCLNLKEAMGQLAQIITKAPTN